jgi:pimeloyl-ACP methyl ester carboxylesterase
MRIGSIGIVAFILQLFVISCCNPPASGFLEEEIVFANKIDGTIFAGTFTKPIGIERFPAAILISGAGQQDRDETVYGHKPLKALAAFLSKNGYGVLRYDDRGIGGSGGDVWNATLEVQAGDAYAGFQYLKTRKDVDPDHTGIIGHSLGALQGTILASKFEDVSFLVMLAGIGLPFSENHIKADSMTNTLKGEPAEIVEAGVKLLKALLSEMKKTPLNQEYHVTKSRLSDIVKDWQSSLSGKAKTETEKFTASDPDFFIKNIAEEYATPIYISCAKYDPSTYLTKIHCPVLSLIGDKDTQVVPENNEVIETHLKNGGNKNHLVAAPKNINHLFQSCETGLINEYGKIEEDFNPEVMMLILNWLNKTEADNHAYEK